MKNHGLLFALFLLLLSITASAQLSGSGISSGGSSSTGAESPKYGGKVPVPEDRKRPVSIPEIKAAINVDGLVNEEAWKSAAVFKNFFQTGPGYNTEPSRPTEAYVMYDEHNLYVAFKCWDEKDKIRATIAKRDNVFGEDNVRFWLDTYNDQRRAYVFGFNPLGIQQDGIYTEGQGADFTPDIVMESKGAIQDWGWSVEVKIPFKSLRYSAGKGKSWGFNMARNIDRFNDEFDQWYPDDRDVSGFLVKFGKITGLDDIKYEKTLELVPSVTVSETGERVAAREIATGRFVNHPIKKDIGLNLKYNFSPNVTLSAAINPDYAEIEADAPVIAANQRFPIYFQEKRPFFLEGKEIFDTPLQVFYSRNIVDPDVAIKLTGKTGKTTFGILAASDNAPGNYSDTDRLRNEQCKERLALGLSNRPCPLDEFIDKNANFAVVRLKRDFGSNNSIGYFGTARIFPQDRNFTNGVDGSIKFNSALVMRFQAVHTYTKQNFYSPVTDTVSYRPGNGLGYFWSLDYTKDTHGWYAEASGRTKDYVSDAGFTRRTNTNTAFFAYRESTKSRPKAKVIRWNFNQNVRYQYDWSGRLQSIGGSGNVNWQMQNQLFMSFDTGYAVEKDYEEEFGAKRNGLAAGTPGAIAGAIYGAPTRTARQPYFSFNVNKTFNKHLSAYGFVGSIYNSMDYDFGAGPRYPRASRAAVILGQGAPLDPGPGTQRDVEVGFTWKALDPLTTSLDYTKSKLTRNDTKLVAYDTNIFSWRTTYQFTRFTFARVRWDYDTLSSRAAGQFLVGWNPNPGTAFYVGYNDTLRYNGFNPYVRDQFGTPTILEPGFNRDSRTFFIRASYLFRKSF
jgi:hypothetical protein